MNELARRFANDLESMILETLHKAGLPFGQVPDDIQDLRCQLDEAMADFIEQVQNPQQEKHQ